MESEKIEGVHWSSWLIGALTLIWNVLGSINFITQMNSSTIASMPQAYRLVINSCPMWASAAFAIGETGVIIKRIEKQKI